MEMSNSCCSLISLAPVILLHMFKAAETVLRQFPLLQMVQRPVRLTPTRTVKLSMLQVNFFIDIMVPVVSW